ncbi:MAG: carboxypeptidase regulatory-like domain-containing protein [Dechloromonas sp.]|nr:MAG: carboxypeptidase regulatory-like domain-containing protein [Dechloromonas sp.]
MKPLIPALLLASLLSTSAIAQSGAHTLPESRYGAISYLSGGIGDEELDEIRLREGDFNLKLLFAERDGSYLAGVDVELTDAKGETVLAVKAAGPFLLVRLPVGNYTVRLMANGQARQGKLAVSAKGTRQAVFRW